MPSTTPTAGSRIYAAHTPAPYLASASATSNLSSSSATAADIPGATVTITTVNANASVQVIGVFDATTTGTGGNAVGTCVVDGATQAGQAIHGLVTNATRETVTQVWNVVLSTAGSHTIKLQGATSGASGTVQFSSTHTTINATVYDW